MDAIKVCFNILTRLKEYGCGSMNTTVRVTLPLVSDRPSVTGYFDRDEQKCECGVGMVIKLTMNHGYRLRIVVDLGKNTKA